MNATRASCLLAAGSLGFATLVGCATDAEPGADPVIDSGPDVAQDAGKDSSVPDTGVDAAKDSSVDAVADVVVDAPSDAAADAQTDAGDAGLPPSGSVCSNPQEIQDEPCGLCGTHYRGCLPVGDGGFTWGAWGFCQGQPANACDPNGVYPASSCGLCGTRSAVCLSNCTFDLSQQCAEPVDACPPGVTDYASGVSCDAGGRERTCSSSCQFGNYGQCVLQPSAPTDLVIGLAGTTVSRNITLSGAIKRLPVTTTCPTSTALVSTLTASAYLKVVNGTVQTATVSIWGSKAANGVNIDTEMTVYPSVLPPADNDDTARKLCSVVINDTCSDKSGVPGSCLGGFAALMLGESHSVTIPPNGFVWVFNQAYSTSGTGPMYVSVRTDALN